MKELELYVHIPFCMRKCEYCDFLSFSNREDAWDIYVEALKEEAAASAASLKDYEVSTVFFGGGTPSLLPAGTVAGILEKLKDCFQFREETEISLEANPGTVTAPKLKIYREAGINRLSFGCQTVKNEELKRLGRIHTFETFLDSWRLAREAGFSNLNVDLMSGLPGQDLISWEQSLEKIAKLQPEHISAYSLILEAGTPMYENREKIVFPEEECERQMYERTHDILEEYGYEQYEISNYAKKGFACRHNLGYWTGTEYLGLGLGASSLLNHVRWRNTDDLDLYLRENGRPEQTREETERLTKKDEQAEFMILGLRMMEGISEEAFDRKFGQDLQSVYGFEIEKHIKYGLLQREGERIFLTRKGISLSNQVMADFL